MISKESAPILRNHTGINELIKIIQAYRFGMRPPFFDDADIRELIIRLLDKAFYYEQFER